MATRLLPIRITLRWDYITVNELGPKLGDCDNICDWDRQMGINTVRLYRVRTEYGQLIRMFPCANVVFDVAGVRV